MLIVAPAIPAPLNGHPALPVWDTFLYLDGKAYGMIATRGYDYAPDGAFHTVAFFPLYPLLIAALVRVTGLPLSIAAVVLSNAAFLVALWVIFIWTQERFGSKPAYWTVLTFCCLPLSIYGSLVYTEGLFLLLTTLALRCFERDAFVAAGLWGALASATRPTGAALVLAFAVGACLRPSSRAWVAALLSSLGIAGFIAFCGAAFGDPLAFVHAQTTWRGDLFSRLWPWQDLMNVLFGTSGPQLWPYQLAIFACVALSMFKRKTLPPFAAFASGGMLTLAELHLWWAGSTVLLIVIVGGIATLLAFRRFGIVPTAFALGAMAMIVSGGYPVSADRIAYSVVPICAALGALWARFPQVGLVALAFFALQLPPDAISIAHGVWWLTNL